MFARLELRVVVRSKAFLQRVKKTLQDFLVLLGGECEVKSCRNDSLVMGRFVGGLSRG
jgi:hypothetical protein